ncbi:S1C family serine protease [Paenibacillus chungangensis]|uniref:S1C family serine protease n=1 Tax=Paenibacillus chungangensis TaxID=696535 RepID=A0ABW3HP21_9BACL
MNKKLTASILLVVIVASFFAMIETEAEQPKRYEADNIFHKSNASLFYLRNIGEYETVRSVGTGVIISDEGLALTAYHVVKHAVELEAVLQDGRNVSGVKVEAYDEGNDVALLRFPKVEEVEAFSALPLRPGGVSHGETVFAIGFPLKETPIITQGIVNSPEAKINGRSRVLTSAGIVSGMSGGPLLDQEGHVVGIISGSLRTMPGIHLVVSIEEVAELVEDFQ